MEQAKAWLQFLAVVSGLLGGLYTAGIALSDTVVTADELAQHDVGARSHPPIQEAVARCEAKAIAAQGRVEELRADQVAMGARMVRMISAEIEPRPALRAARASFYEDQFRGLVHRGMPIEEATLEALRTPWLNRPR
jgi:hypothetical protein